MGEIVAPFKAHQRGTGVFEFGEELNPGEQFANHPV